MSMFPENIQAEIDVKKIVLRALLERKKELDPTTVYLNLEIDQTERDIANAEKRLAKD